MKISKKNPLIYIVDDDMLFCKAIIANLKINRLVNVKQFSYGEDMLSQFAKEPSSIVLQDFDLGFGRLNGLEIFKKARAMKPNVEFIFLSGQNDINVAIEAIKMGAFDYVVKENNAFDILLSRIKKVIFQKKLADNQIVYNKLALIFICTLIVSIIVAYFMGVRLVVK